MELFIISGYAAICIVTFTVLRIPLNRWTVPSASVGGLVLSFALIQVLNFFICEDITCWIGRSGNTDCSDFFSASSKIDMLYDLSSSANIKRGCLMVGAIR